jgi:Ca2+-binding EF-hand superfamily protein
MAMSLTEIPHAEGDAFVTSNSRKESIAALFELFDLDGNGSVGLNELTQVMHASRKSKTKNRQHRKWVLQLEANVRQAVETNKKMGHSHDYQLKTGGKIEFDTDGEPSLDPAAFEAYVLKVTEGISDADFLAFVETSNEAVDTAREHTAGNDGKKIIWNIFQMLDNNRDGFVDLDELEVLLEIETKSDKKAIAKWKAELTQKQHDDAANQANLSPERSVSPGGALEDVLDNTTASQVLPAVTMFDSAGLLRLALADFQHFMHDFTGGAQVEKLNAIYDNVAKALRQKHQQYLDTMKVSEIMDRIVDDLLRERPRDVVQGIKASCERMQRVGVFPRKLYRRASHVSLASASLESSMQ